jgi:hypothetical protein
MSIDRCDHGDGEQYARGHFRSIEAGYRFLYICVIEGQYGASAWPEANLVKIARSP